MRDIMDVYKDTAIEHCRRWGVDNPHIIDICQSVMMDRDGYMVGGGFVNSVNKNNLRDAVNRADTDCIKHLKVIVMASINSFIPQSYYNEVVRQKTRVDS